MHVDAGPRNGDESHAVINRIANCSRSAVVMRNQRPNIAIVPSVTHSVTNVSTETSIGPILPGRPTRSANQDGGRNKRHGPATEWPIGAAVDVCIGDTAAVQAALNRYDQLADQLVKEHGAPKKLRSSNLHLMMCRALKQEQELGRVCLMNELFMERGIQGLKELTKHRVSFAP